MKKNLFFTFLLLFTFTWTMAQKAPTVVRNDQQRRADIAKLVYVSPFTQINGDYFSDKMEKNSKLSEKEDQFPSNPAKVTYTKKSMDFASKGVIFTDGFEHAGTSGVWENDPSNDYDWTFIKNSTSGGGAITGDNTTGTGYFAYFDSYSADKDDIGLLNSPTIDLSGTTSAKLDFFWNRKNAGYTSRLEVNIFADGTWNNDIQPGLDQQTTGWESVTVDLAAYAFNDVVVQFKVVGDWWRNIGLDDVLVYEPQPYSFAVNYPQGTVVSVAGSCLYTVTINNTGTSADNFTPAIATGGSWSYELLQADGVTPLTEVMSIPSGGSADYKIKVTAPATGLVDGDTDTQEFSITSAEGGKAVENFSITTTFITPLYLPIYDGFEEGNTNQQPVASWDMVKVTGTEGWLANSAQTSYNRTPRTGSFNAHLKYNNTAWLFTKKPVALEAAELYRFSVYARQDGATATNASITLKYGTSATAAGMTYVAKALTGVVAGDYQLIEGLFSPEADGIYYLGVLGTINGSPWYISIDDISVEEVPGIEPALTSITAPNPINWALSNEEVKVVLKNNGAQNLTAAQISWSVAGAEQTPFEWAGDLVMGASEEVTIGTFDFTEFGEFEIIANVIVAEDNDETNNTVSTTVCFYEPFELPYATEFNGNLDVWSSLSIVGGKYFTWTTVGGAFGGQLESTTAENGYAMFDNLNGTEIGVNPAEAALVSPIFDLTGIANALMSFEYMARQLGKDFDVAYPNLLIKVEGSNDGFNADIQELWSYQFPDEAHMFNDGKVYVNLTPIANQANVQIRFRYIGGGGYWWLIDDVNMWETPANDIMVNDVMFSQDINMAGSDVVISVSVLNVGGVDQTDVDVTVNVNGTDFVANIPAIAVLEEIVVPVTWTAAVAGRHTITATLPDDENNENNTGTTQGVVVAEGQLAEGFEGTWVPTLWEAETGWINWDQVWSAQWEGTKGAACGSQYGFSNSKLITPLLQIGANEELNFYATVGNPIADPKTSIQVMYSADKVTWTAIGDLIELTEEMKLYTIDLASLTGNYYLAFSASGAASGSTWATWAIVDHVVGPNPVPFYEVTLNTTDQDAAALSGVKVVYEGIVSGTVTTVGGTATVLLCDGAYNYTATKANYYEVTGIIVVDGINVTEDIQLDAYPTVTFSVQDQVPDNLAGVSIKYVGITTEVTGSLTTLADGTVTFRLPADTYTYTATKANYYAIEGSVVVADVDVTEPISMQIFPLVTFTVQDQESANLEGVSISYLGTTTATTGSLTTLVEGTATVRLPADTYTYTATKDDYLGVEGSVVVADVDVTEPISMQIMSLVTFTVQDQEPANLAGVSIEYEGATNGTTGVLTTSITGVIAVRLPADTYTYTATKANYYAIEGSVVVADIDVSEPISMQIFPNIIIEVTNDLAAVVSDATVTIDGYLPLTTDDAGIVTKRLEMDSYSGTVHAIGYQIATFTFDVITNDDMNVYVVLTPAAPTLGVDVIEYEFAPTVINASSASKVFTIQNTGQETLTINPENITITGDGAAYFQLTTLTETANLTVGQTATFSVVFNPTVNGLLSAVIEIEDNLGKGVTQIAISGESLDPTINVFPYTQTFEEESFPALGWNTYKQGALVKEWERNSSYNHTNTGLWSARHIYGSGYHDGWLVMPAIAVPADGSFKLSFWSYNVYPNDYGKNSVLISTGSNDPASGDFVQVWSPTSVTDSWVETTLGLMSYAGQTIYVAFRYEGNFAHTWHIDDINISQGFALTLNALPVVDPVAGVLTGAGVYSEGDVVAVNAVANPGYSFVNWTNESSEVVSTTAAFDYTVINADVELTANFISAFEATFTVTDQAAKTLAGVSIEYSGDDASGTLTTNAGGLATVYLPNGTYTYTATKADYYAVAGVITVNEGAVAENITMQIMPLVTFTVQNAGAVPINGATITLDGQAPITTVGAGVAKLRLPNGEYSGTAYKIGFEQFVVAFTVADNTDMTVAITLNTVAPTFAFKQDWTEGADFGNQLSGVNTSTITFQFTNVGTGALTVNMNDFSLSGDDAFLFGANYTDIVLNLPIGATRSLSVKFQPTVSGIFTGQLNYANAGEPIEIVLNGTAYDAIASPFAEDFESGNFNNWLVVNGTQVNQWFVGTADGDTDNLSAIVSNDGGVTNAYTTSGAASTSHFYMDFAIPAVADGQIGDVILNFDWKGIGESSYDCLKIFSIDPVTTPVAGTQLSTGQIGAIYSHSATWQNSSINVPVAQFGKTRRIVFSWRNDGGGGTNPALAVDNIKLLEVREIASLEVLDNITVPYQTAIEDLMLPAMVTATLDGEYFGATTANIGITWDMGTPVYDGAILGDYIFEGILSEFPAGVYNTAALVTTVTVTVEAGALVMTWPTATAITYGEAYSASTLENGLAMYNDVEQDGIFDFYSPEVKPAAGIQDVNVVFTPMNNNFVTPSMTVAVEVMKYPAVINVTELTHTWSATPKSVVVETQPTTDVVTGNPIALAYTVTYEGINGTVYAATTDAPDAIGFYETTVEIVEDNYVGVSVVEMEINNKITPVITWPVATAINYGDKISTAVLTGGLATYLNEGVVTQLDGTFAFAKPDSIPNVGVRIFSMIFTPDDVVEYNLVNGTVSVEINQAVAVVTAWPTAAEITYGQTLADATLIGGTATGLEDVALTGVYAFTNPAEMPLAGTATFSATFTPTSANYAPVVTLEADYISVMVNKATPTLVELPVATAITYTETLADAVISGGVINGIAGVIEGLIAFDVPTTMPNAGTANFAATFTPTDIANYTTLPVSISVVVNKANPIVTTWPTASDIFFGQALSVSILTGGVADVAGTFAFTVATEVPTLGGHTYSVTFRPTMAANYNTVVTEAADFVAINVVKTTPTVTILPVASDILLGEALSASTLTGGVAQGYAGAVAGTFAFETPATIPATIGTYSAVVVFTPTDAVNYETVNANVDVQVLPSSYNVTFTVKNNLGTAIEGASIAINSEVITTNVSGVATIDLINGSYPYTVTHAEYNEITGTVAVADAAVAEPVVMIETIVAPEGLEVVVDGFTATITYDASSGAVLTESFEEAVPPTGWTLDNTNSVTWAQAETITFSTGDVAPVDGTFQAFLMWEYSAQDEWLITPSFNVPTGADLTFWSYSGAIGSTNGDHYYVKVSTDGGTTWTPIWDAVDAAAADYEEVTVALSAYQGQDIKLAWQGVDGDGQGLWFTWFIDHITIGNGKNVISFNDLQFVSKASSNSSVVSERTFSRDGSVEVVSNRSAKGFVDYKIYLDDMTTPYAQNVTATSFEFTELAAGNYIAGVQRVYETGASEIVTIPFEIVEPEYDVTFTVKSSGAVVAGAKIKVGTTEKTTNASGVAVFTMVDGNYTYIVTKDGYQAANGSFIVNGANLPVAVNLLVGMDDVAANLVKLYPNPVVDILTIERGNNEQVIAEIYNSNGTLINSTNVEDAIITFDVSYMSSGSYYIRLIGTSNTTIHRFIKQ